MTVQSLQLPPYLEGHEGHSVCIGVTGNSKCVMIEIDKPHRLSKRNMKCDCGGDEDTKWMVATNKEKGRFVNS